MFTTLFVIAAVLPVVLLKVVVPPPVIAFAFVPPVIFRAPLLVMPASPEVTLSALVVNSPSTVIVIPCDIVPFPVFDTAPVILVVPLPLMLPLFVPFAIVNSPEFDIVPAFVKVSFIVTLSVVVKFTPLLIVKLSCVNVPLLVKFPATVVEPVPDTVPLFVPPFTTIVLLFAISPLFVNVSAVIEPLFVNVPLATSTVVCVKVPLFVTAPLVVTEPVPVIEPLFDEPVVILIVPAFVISPPFVTFEVIEFWLSTVPLFVNSAEFIVALFVKLLPSAVLLFRLMQMLLLPLCLHHRYLLFLLSCYRYLLLS